ncbi:lytic transglycosylase domain-containing protein [Algihabitans albus]|uniref:lytic transglycosylase domain-containing protein n=1 Tax=Algihabitans albus TaxID=2164067 RepID=UPI0013C2EB69|nr:lytic transglycosylase domain-containing protein [Algihabitans albus]
MLGLTFGLPFGLKPQIGPQTRTPIGRGLLALTLACATAALATPALATLEAPKSGGIPAGVADEGPGPVPGGIPHVQPLSPWELCGRNIAAAEQLLNLPKHLLTALSRTESGRWSRERQAHLAWPWTVMAEGKGRYLPTKAAAIAEVESLKARGVRNIDVGCMQINLHFHPDAFESITQAFDPAFNVAYAAKFLTDLRAKTNSWTKAIGRYHSATPAFANRYRGKVFRYWNEEKRLAAQAAREARRAAREAAKAQASAVSLDAHLAGLADQAAPGAIR